MKSGNLRVYPYSDSSQALFNIEGMSSFEEVPEQPSEDQVDPPVPEGLRRSVANRKVAGVAGGIGARLDIDANIVRVAFIVLTFLWGLGAAVYLAMWALVPPSGTSYASDHDEVAPEDKKRFGLRGVVLLAGALCLGLLFLSVALGGIQFGRGISVVWLIFLVALAILSLRRPVRRISLTRLIAGFFIAVISVLILGVGAVLSYLSFAGVPFSGGAGSTMFQPTTIAQVHHTYRYAMGDMTIDLRGVNFEGRTVSVTATVALGTLNVEVPPGVKVNLVAESGSNNIQYPLGQQQFNVVASSKVASQLNLTVKIGIGTINLFRAGPGSSLTGYFIVTPPVPPRP